MIYTILYWLIIVPLLTLTLIHVINGVLVYRSLEFYRKQGVKTEFYPLFGIFIGLVRGAIKKAKGTTNDEMEDFGKFFVRDNKIPFFVVGGSTYAGLGIVNVMVIDAKFSKKIYNSEVKYNMPKVNTGGTMGYKGLLFADSPINLPRKAIYANLARSSSNILIFDDLKKIVVSQIKALKEELKLDVEGKVKTQINLKPFFFNLINKMLMVTMFNGQLIQTGDNHTICEYACDIFSHWFQMASSPLTHLLFGLLNDGLFEQSWINPIACKKEQKRKYEISHDLMYQAFEEHALRNKDVPCDQLKDNVLDNILKEQRRRDKAGEPRISIKDLASDVVEMCFGGQDTSTGFLTNGYTAFINQDKQDKFLDMMLEMYGDESKGKKVIRPDVTFDEIMWSERYTAWWKEMLRVTDLIQINFERMFTKDMEIDGYKFKKGHFWSQAATSVHNNPETNPNPQDLNFDRFLKGKAPEGQEDYGTNIFGHGKRICIGYQIAEMSVKLSCMYISSAFKFEIGADYTDAVPVDITKVQESLFVNVQCRTEFWENIDSY